MGSNTNLEGYMVWKKAFPVIWYLHSSPINYFQVGKKIIIMLWGLREEKKMDISLQIVLYAGFRFNPGKYSKIHQEKHSKLTSHYT